MALGATPGGVDAPLGLGDSEHNDARGSRQAQIPFDLQAVLSPFSVQGNMQEENSVENKRRQSEELPSPLIPLPWFSEPSCGLCKYILYIF